MTWKLALLLAAAACGGPSWGAVTVETPGREGVHIYFQSADGSVLGDAVTDATGEVSGPIDVGGFVTAIDPFGHDDILGDQLFTYMGVEPGDRLTYLPPAPSWGSGAEQVTVQLTYPAATDPLVDGYQVFAAGCSVSNYPSQVSGATVSVQLTLERCGDTVDLMVLASHVDSTSLTPRAWGFANAVAVAPTMTVAWAYEPFAMQTATITNFPPIINNRPDLTSNMYTAHGALYGAMMPLEAAGTYSLQIAPFPSSTNVINLNVWGDNSVQQIVDAGPYVDAFTIDVASRLVADATRCPTFDHDTRELTWTEGDGGAIVDYATATLQVAPQDRPPYEWHVMGVPQAAKLVLPEELNAYRFEGLDYFHVATLLRGTVEGGYEQLRTTGVWPLTSDGYLSEVRSLSVLGHVTTAATNGCMPL